MILIKRSQANDLINSTNGKFFRALFIKKDGTDRLMTYRLGVTKHLNGGELKFSPSDKGFVVVFDIEKREYRMINLNSIKTLQINKKIYVVEG